MVAAMSVLLRIVIPMLLVLLASFRPSGQQPVERIDDFILKRLEDDEKAAIASQAGNEWLFNRIATTCQARRKMVSLYRSSRDRPEANSAYALILSIIAELYDDHPDYWEGWRPMISHGVPTAIAPGTERS
jgi:hypothetical protein